jgi:predicted outer membrane repeat protein
MDPESGRVSPHSGRSLAACLLLALAFTTACHDLLDPGPRTPTTPEPGPKPTALGLIEVTISGIGDAAPTAAARNLLPAAGTLRSLSGFAPITEGDEEGIQIEQLSTGSFTVGTRGVDGQRYLYAIFRVRNASTNGVAYTTERRNLTFLAVDTDATPGTSPVSTLRRFDGSFADPAIAAQLVPTGAAAQAPDGALTSRYPDVLQLMSAADLAGLVAVPPGVSVLPYGFVVSVPTDAHSRTLPASPAADAFDGVVTFAFRLPLQAAAAEDPFTLSVMFLAVDDDVVRVTQSPEEQDDDGAAAFLARANALGATVRTVLWGSPLESQATLRTLCGATVFLSDPAACALAPAGVLFVDAAATGADNGSSWANAFTTLQDALSAARASGGISEIWMAEGVYRPDQGSGFTAGDRGAGFDLVNGLTIRGGFRVDGAVGTERAPANYVTTLSGDLLADDLPGFVNMADNTSASIVRVAADTTAALDGVVVTGGNGATGGGIRNAGVLELSSVVVTGNRASSNGGGIYNSSTGTIELTDVTIDSNWAVSGGGAYAVGPANLRNVDFVSNQAVEEGGGLLCANGTVLRNVNFQQNNAKYGAGFLAAGPVNYEGGNVIANVAAQAGGGGATYQDVLITDVTFENNTAANIGGALYGELWNNNLTLVRSTFTGNRAPRGASIVPYSVRRLVILNSVFVDNRAATNGIDVWVENPGELLIGNKTFADTDSINILGQLYDPTRVMIANSILHTDLAFSGAQLQMNVANVVSNTFSCEAILALGGGSTCEGLLSADPGFSDPAGGDFRLLTSSPAVDAGPGLYDPYPGSDAASQAWLQAWLYAHQLDDLAVDRDGKPRIVNGRIDLGAYEVQSP